MPKLSDSMEEGTILSWLKEDGDLVAAGEDLVEIETDKATMTHGAQAGGRLRIVAAVGASLPVGATIALVGDPGEEADIEVPAVVTADPAADIGRRAVVALRATPLARRVAEAHGVALEDVTGSGPHGRVTRADVLAKAGIVPAPSARMPPPAATPPAKARADEGPTAKGEVEAVELSRLQTVVARRMVEAKATVPHFQVETEVVMDPAMALRAELNADGPRTASLNDLVVKAVALALRAHPMANGAYRDGRFELYSRVNVGIAVATDEALLVPTIFDADQKSVGTIAAEARTLAGRVRDRTITPAELSGATFTVSNLGMYGMTAITPVINMPQAAILGVGAIRDVLARVDGDVVDRHLVTLRLSCDHRILYGADAARFLSAIRELLEQPLRLAL